MLEMPGDPDGVDVVVDEHAAARKAANTKAPIVDRIFMYAD
jgi:hypothetical protein